MKNIDIRNVTWYVCQVCGSKNTEFTQINIELLASMVLVVLLLANLGFLFFLAKLAYLSIQHKWSWAISW